MQADTQTLRKIILNGSSVYIPLGKAVALIALLFGAYVWLDARFQALEEKLTVIEFTLGDRWTGADMRLWAEKLKAANFGSVNVPEPSHQRDAMDVAGVE